MTLSDFDAFCKTKVKFYISCLNWIQQKLCKEDDTVPETNSDFPVVPRSTSVSSSQNTYAATCLLQMMAHGCFCGAVLR